MQRKYFGIVAVIFLLVNNLFGQAIDSTLTIKEVEVIAQKKKYLVGAKIENIDSIKLEALSGATLADLIIKNLPIYIKQDAGGLSTINFRGTSPNHTAIMFNGININSLTLGHSNLSDIPAFLFDDVQVQFGSSSSLYGTDAIGGSIHLNNKPIWNSGLNIGLQQDIGSFDLDFSGLKLGYSNKKVSYTLKLFRQFKQNNFPFLNTAIKDFEKGGFIDDTMKNAAILNSGLLQEICYKISDNMHSYVKVWYGDNWHQIQPNVSTNYYGGSFTEIQNKNLRLVSGLSYFKGRHKLSADLGYVHDYEIYNNDSLQTIITNSFISNVDYYNSKFLKGDLNIGFNYQHIKPNVYAYDKNLKEDRIDLFSSYKKSLFKNLVSSLNIRETIVLDYQRQFTPSLGFNYDILKSELQSIDCKLAVSRSYKIPTFNDRFWYLAGNPDLLPEKGLNYELGLNYKQQPKNNILRFGITCFYLDIDDWIHWVPAAGGIWTPKNKAKVQSKGLELTVDESLKISKIKINIGFNFSINKVILVKDYTKNSIEIGKQLIYTPEHIGAGNFSFEYKKWTFYTSASYTGIRHYAHNESNDKIIDDYILLNSSLGKKIQFKKHAFSMNFNISNILNKAYQNQYFYAMPGRNYSISIKYLINNLIFKNNENN